MNARLSRGLARLTDAPGVRSSLGRALGHALQRGLFRIRPLAPEVFAAERPPTPAPPASDDPFVWRAPADVAVAEGPLGGAPTVVKDSVAVAGAHRTDGTRDATPPATADAALVARLRAGGARIIGTVQMTELGVDGLGYQPHQGTLDNPAAPGYVTGGSSSGTAYAVAAGLARFGVGTDALGSVRIPASYCGLVGLKPTHGSLPRDGYDSIAESLDMPGPIAATVADTALLWQVLADRPITRLAPASSPVVGVVAELERLACAGTLRAATARALDAIGARRVPVSVAGADDATTFAVTCSSFEMARHPSPPVRAPSPEVHFIYNLGCSITARDYAWARRRRAGLTTATLAALERCDALAMPTTAIPPTPRTAAMTAGGTDAVLLASVGAFTPLANATGLPAISVPAGRDERGRPLGVMFVGRPGAEEVLFALAAAVEAAGVGRAPVSAPGGRR